MEASTCIQRKLWPSPQISNPKQYMGLLQNSTYRLHNSRYIDFILCATGRSSRICKNGELTCRFNGLETNKNWGFSWNSKHTKLFPVVTAVSSFAEANEGTSDENSEISVERDITYYMDNATEIMEKNGNSHDEPEETDVKPTGSTSGMAKAFKISSRTAFGITTVIAFSALVLPLLMSPVTTAGSMRIRVLSYATLLFGFYMAWNIGANDVANAMGTSVGSGALTLRQAVLMAAVLEFSGAFLVGSHVTKTMQKGILETQFFSGKDQLLFCGMLSSLAAAGTWLQVASYYGWPVSTTHCIVGALVGFGLIYGGPNAIYWSSIGRIVSSWVISPAFGAAMSFCIYKLIRKVVYSAPNPGQAAATVAPIAVFIGVSAFSLTAFPMMGNPTIVLARAMGCGIVAAYIMKITVEKQFGYLLGEYCEIPLEENKGKGGIWSRFFEDVGGPIGSQLRVVYGVFGYLQVLSACFMSFAHGANDVANAIGPISSALATLHGAGVNWSNVSLSTEVLAWGGFGIVAGLLVWGYRVIKTIGKKITELTPTRGFAAEFAAATVVVLASRAGLPISATHTLVGAVMGVGFARGLQNVRAETVREIIISWVVTIPAGALLSIIYTTVIMKLLAGGF